MVNEGQKQGQKGGGQAEVSPMKDVSAKILISDIFLDESIYPRENMDYKRINSGDTLFNY